VAEINALHCTLERCPLGWRIVEAIAAMGVIEILWTVAGILVPLLLGTAWAMIGLSPPEFAIARGCVAVAAIVFIGISFVWLVVLHWPTGARIVAAAAMGRSRLLFFQSHSAGLMTTARQSR
jgi:hypothetical protein